MSGAPDLDVARAQADADAVLAQIHAFCDKPRVPPRLQALRYCELSKEIPNCEGFQKQCASIFEQKHTEPPAWLESFARFLAKIAPYLGWTFLAIAIVVVLYVIGQAIYRRLTRKDEPEQADAEPDVTVTEARPEAAPVDPGSPESILARAEAAFARGDLRAALFGFLHAALRALDVRGAIRIARDRTNGEYVRSCSDAAARPELRAIVYEVDVVQFGGRAPEVERVREAGRRAAALVRAAALALLVVLSLGVLTGCSSAPSLSPTRGNDPAGFDVAPKLLEKQGFKLRAPEVPLAKLEAPTPAKPSPPLVLDLTRTDLDTDAVEGLERFVKGGGVLVLFGSPWEWPPTFRTTTGGTSSRDILVEVGIPPVECDEPSQECEDKAAEVLRKMEAPPQHAHLAEPAAFRWEGQPGRPIAHAVEDEKAIYASFGEFEKGQVLGVASADLLTNAGLARPGNPGALIAILSHLGTRELLVAGEHAGITPIENPLAALFNAGLGLPIGHALAFAILLAIAVGARYRAPRPLVTTRRRAFVEHVEATGALYAFTNAAPHALAAYGRFAVERLRTRLAKGGDLAGTLAQRAGVSREEAQRVLDRATLVKAGDAARGDELAVLRDLSELYARAADPMSPEAHRTALHRFKTRR